MISVSVFSPGQRVIALIMKMMSEDTIRVAFKYPKDVKNGKIVYMDCEIGKEEDRVDYDTLVPRDDTLAVREHLLRLESFEIPFRSYRQSGEVLNGVARVKNDLLTDFYLPRQYKFGQSMLRNGTLADGSECGYKEAAYTTAPTFELSVSRGAQIPAAIRPLYQYILTGIEDQVIGGRNFTVVEVRGPSNILFRFEKKYTVRDSLLKENFSILGDVATEVGTSERIPSFQEEEDAMQKDLETSVMVYDTETDVSNPFNFGQFSYGPNRTRIDSESTIIISKIVSFFEIYRLVADKRIARSDLLHRIDVNDDYHRSIQKLLSLGVRLDEHISVPVELSPRGLYQVPYLVREAISMATANRTYFSELYSAFSYDANRVTVTNTAGQTALLSSVNQQDNSKVTGCFVLSLAKLVASSIVSACPHLTMVGCLSALINSNAVGFHGLTFYGETASLNEKTKPFTSSAVSVYGDKIAGRLVDLKRETVRFEALMEGELAIVGLDYDGDPSAAEHFVLCQKEGAVLRCVYDSVDKFYGVVAPSEVVAGGVIRFTPVFEKDGIRHSLLVSTVMEEDANGQLS